MEISRPEKQETLEVKEEKDDEDEFYQAFIQALKQKDPPPEREAFDEKGIGNNNFEETKQQQIDFLSEDEGMGEYVKQDFDDIGDDYFTKQKKLAEKKDLKPVDHAKMGYDTFRKNFYIESKEITGMSIEQKVSLRKELGDIKVRGKNCPAPITNWYQCGLSDKILKILIEKRKYGKPFPIQCQVKFLFPSLKTYTSQSQQS